MDDTMTTQLSSPQVIEEPLVDTQDGTLRALPHALLAAFLAIEFALISGFWYGMIGLGKIDWSRFSGFLIAPKASDITQYLVGYLASSINGTIFGLAFLYLIRPLIPIPSTRIGNFVSGQIMGVVLSVIALAWWTPANFPQFNPGVFSSNLGVKIIIGTFVWHAVYFLQLTCFSDAFGKHQWKARGISLKSIGLKSRTIPDTHAGEPLG
jgi:hypothetical protein